VLAATACTVAATVAFAGHAGAAPLCNMTITGTHAGTVAVTSGLTCVLGATVNGDVDVVAGASVIIRDSHVAGSVNAHRAGVMDAVLPDPIAVGMCDDTVDGAVNIADSMSRVVVGNVFIGCAANKIGTRMVLDENTQGIAAINNTVGSLIAYNNSGAVIIISGNHP